MAASNIPHCRTVVKLDLEVAGAAPFNPVTVLSLDIPRESQVELGIYSIDGKLEAVPITLLK